MYLYDRIEIFTPHIILYRSDFISHRPLNKKRHHDPSNNGQEINELAPGRGKLDFGRLSTMGGGVWDEEARSNLALDRCKSLTGEII